MYILRQEKLRNNNVAATQNDIFNFAEVIKKVRARACVCVRKGVCGCVCECVCERERGAFYFSRICSNFGRTFLKNHFYD